MHVIYSHIILEIRNVTDSQSLWIASVELYSNIFIIHTFTLPAIWESGCHLLAGLSGVKYLICFVFCDRLVEELSDILRTSVR